MSKDLYDTLGVDEDASEKEIKDAYRKESKKHHPDAGGDEEKFKKAADAYAILSNPEKRKQYDETGSTDGSDPLAGIMGEMSQLFFKVISENKKDIQYTNIIDIMLKVLSNAISLAKNDKTQKDKEIAKTKTLLGRVKRKNDDSENFFEGIIKGRIQQLQHDKLLINNQIKRFEFMIDFIDVYECSVMERPETRR